jgi:hypothetical protein
MKKLFSTLIAVLGVSFLMAQSVTVPAGVQKAFLGANKDVKVEWTATSQNYMAKWNNGDKKITSVYVKDETGTLVRTETDVQLSELSTPVQTSIKDRFTGVGSMYTFIRGFKVEGGSANVVEGADFEMNSNGKKSVLTIFFDATGAMVKREIN